MPEDLLFLTLDLSITERQKKRVTLIKNTKTKEKLTQLLIKEIGVCIPLHANNLEKGMNPSSPTSYG